MNIAVFVEVREGAAKKASLEALSEARRWADKKGMTVSAVVVGSPAEDAAQKVSSYKPDRVIVIDEPAVASYSASAYAAALAAAIQKEGSKYVFLSATAMGKEVAARTAAKFKTSVLADVISLEWNGSLQARRPVYSGKAIAVVQTKGDAPVFVTLRPNVFSALAPDPNHKAAIEKISTGLNAAD